MAFHVIDRFVQSVRGQCSHERDRGLRESTTLLCVHMENLTWVPAIMCETSHCNLNCQVVDGWTGRPVPTRDKDTLIITEFNAPCHQRDTTNAQNMDHIFLTILHKPPQSLSCCAMSQVCVCVSHTQRKHGRKKCGGEGLPCATDRSCAEILASK